MSVDTFVKLFHSQSPWLVITGAGVSLSSGIPTYRDQEGNWLRSDPITHQQFIQSEASRRRYWARSTVGWPAVAKAKPNQIHFALKELERKGLVSGLITQNVDRLHQRAGHQQVLDLHGRLDRVVCLECGQTETRDDLQLRLLEKNPFLETIERRLTPDGDADLEDELTEKLTLIACQHCDGVLKPDVVFFGGTIAKSVHEHTASLYEKAKSVLIIGSSLKVYSGFRICKQAKADGKLLAILNPGITRADDIADYKFNGDACHYLSAV